MSVLYHHTDTARLPWILSSGELRPGANKIGGFPDPDFLWATTDARGDATASAHRGEAYRAGHTRDVRFTLLEAYFAPWSWVPGQLPQWTADHVARLEAAAQGKSNCANWWCCERPIRQWLAIHTRSYRDNRWMPLDLKTEVMTFASHGVECWLGVGIGSTLFLSRRMVGPQGQDAFEVKTIAADGRDRVMRGVA